MADKQALAEAIKAVMGAVSEADSRDFTAGRKPKSVSIEVEEAAPGECEGCARGECSDPEHASEDELSSLLGA